MQQNAWLTYFVRLFCGQKFASHYLTWAGLPALKTKEALDQMVEGCFHTIYFYQK